MIYRSLLSVITGLSLIDELDRKSSKPPVVKSGTTFICRLSTEEQLKRKEELYERILPIIKKTEELKNGYTFIFNYDVDRMLLLTDWIMTENNCCPFFTFSTTIHDRDDIRIAITGEGKSKEMLAMLIDKMPKNE